MTAPPGPRVRAAAAMAMTSIVSVQCGAALATTLFAEIGTQATVFLRAATGALALLVLAGGSLRAARGGPLREIVLFGLTLAGMSVSFYAAIDRLPLGIAVTLEFTGPLAVAVLGSRRRRDLLWVGLAAAGIVLLTNGVGGEGVDAVGVVLALVAGAFWGAYILLSARVGRSYPGVSGAAVAAVIAAVLVAPLGIAEGGGELLVPEHLALGLAVGVLTAAVPVGLEMEALRRLPKAVFGVLMSLEPAIAALVGFVALSQDLSATEVAAIGLVVCACAGALRSATTPVPHDA